MTPPSHRLRTHQTQSTATSSSQSSQVHEFASAEDLIRADAATAAVPPAVERRLAESISREPPPTGKPWWKRIFS